jgi:formylglycine-generating enzyme required for sulfatase activity
VEHACVDVCEAVECGPVGQIDCGDCSGLGWGWACQAGSCVQPCQGLECGEVLGVDCGQCENGFSCNAEHLCEPFALPGMAWVKLTGGSFTLGCDNGLDPACDFDEQRHPVLLSEFWIMDTEVTVAMYNLCVTDGECLASHAGTGGDCNLGKSGYGQHPINCLDWEGLQEFCAYVGGNIPTEAQWERAMRGDHDGVASTYWIYPWGSTPAPSCARVVMNEGVPGCGLGSTNAVKGKPATGAGLYDMGGNVSEWVRDWYSEALGGCGIGDCVDPAGPDNGVERVVRGGHWNDLYASAFRTAMRDKGAPSAKSAGIGGRCVRW